MDLEQHLAAALKAPRPSHYLRDVAIDLLAQGHDREALYDAFEQLRQRLQDADREEEEVVMDVMDCFVGWCAPSWRI